MGCFLLNQAFLTFKEPPLSRRERMVSCYLHAALFHSQWQSCYSFRWYLVSICLLSLIYRPRSLFHDHALAGWFWLCVAYLPLNSCLMYHVTYFNICMLLVFELLGLLSVVSDLSERPALPSLSLVCLAPFAGLWNRISPVWPVIMRRSSLNQSSQY